MPTNRPFFANFLAAFRAHSAISKTTTTTTTTTSTSTSSSTAASASAFSPPSLTSRSLTTKATTTSPTSTTSPTTAAVQAATTSSHLRHPSSTTSPTARSPPSTSNFTRPPQRRGSDSSSEGFRELGEKWYVGGRTANGEERFYKLGMVRRERSGDRLSLDRLSI